jgi:hypothetical protein
MLGYPDKLNFSTKSLLLFFSSFHLLRAARLAGVHRSIGEFFISQTRQQPPTERSLQYQLAGNVKQNMLHLLIYLGAHGRKVLRHCTTLGRTIQLTGCCRTQATRDTLGAASHRQSVSLFPRPSNADAFPVSLSSSLPERRLSGLTKPAQTQKNKSNDLTTPKLMLIKHRVTF